MISHIRKEDLVVGAYYRGTCREATIARWNGEIFIYWRSNKFGNMNTEEIFCPEDAEDYEDAFYAFTEVDQGGYFPIPIQA